MEKLVAGRYVKALIAASSKDELEEFSEFLNILKEAYKDERVKEVFESKMVREEIKERILLKAVDKIPKKLENLIKLLSQKKRLYVLPYISEELDRQLAALENRYEGKIYGSERLKGEEIREIENSLSKKMGVNVVLHKQKEAYSGIKVEIESLGVEISFSKSQIKRALIEHILKAI